MLRKQQVTITSSSPCKSLGTISANTVCTNGGLCQVEFQYLKIITLTFIIDWIWLGWPRIPSDYETERWFLYANRRGLACVVNLPDAQWIYASAAEFVMDPVVVIKLRCVLRQSPACFCSAYFPPTCAFEFLTLFNFTLSNSLKIYALKRLYQIWMSICNSRMRSTMTNDRGCRSCHGDT